MGLKQMVAQAIFAYKRIVLETAYDDLLVTMGISLIQYHGLILAK